MPSEVRIQIDVEREGSYRFRVRNGVRQITTEVPATITTSIYEDLRLLRWKSMRIRDPGDVLLANVGDRLASLVASPEQWNELGLQDEPRQVRVQFSHAAYQLMPFPWELLRVNATFLIGVQGSHLVRAVTGQVGQKRRNPRLSVVHVSLGTDSNLQFDEERAALLETIPDNIPIEFLISPSREHFQTVLDVFRPHIIIVSGHGNYDDLQGEHYLDAGDGDRIRTRALVSLCASYGCKLLVLSTCESARLGSSVVNSGAVLPADLIAFTFPVRSDTAIQSLQGLFRELVQGKTVNHAMAAVRAIDNNDVYTFFNTVHLHRERAQSIRIRGALPPPAHTPAPRCPGMELALRTLNSVAHTSDPTTLVAAVGSGGDILIEHWAALVRRSQTMAERWRVLLDGRPILDVPGAQVVRLAYTYSFVPMADENLLYSDGMDKAFAYRQLAEMDQDLARRVEKHPLIGMPSFVEDLRAGRTEQEAVERFEQANNMGERSARLSRAGAIFASSLYVNESYVPTSYDDRHTYAQDVDDLGIPAAVIVAGIENAVGASVMLVRPDSLLLAPEFMLLGDRWFPDWRTDLRPMYQLLVTVISMLAAYGDVNPEQTSRLLDWAIRREDWEVAVRVCVILSGWFGEHGRLDEMEDTIEQVLPRANGMAHIVLLGHLVTIATNHGDYRKGLEGNQQLERELEAFRDHEDYSLNQQATITQQIDCLIELNRLDEAQQRLQDAHDLLPGLGDNQGESEARLFGQLAHLRREQDRGGEAIDAATQAVDLAIEHHCPEVLIAELHHSKADLLRRAGRDREAIAELNAVANMEMPPLLRSKFLHLKGIILEQYNAPGALEHLLQSYEEDLMRGDNAGVAISLLSIARIYADEQDYHLARERINEALPLADECGLVDVVARLSLLKGEIDVAEGHNESAVTWLNNARNKFTEEQNSDGVERATRLLTALSANQ